MIRHPFDMCVLCSLGPEGTKASVERKAKHTPSPDRSFAEKQNGSAHVRNVILEMFFVAAGNGIVAIATRTRG